MILMVVNAIIISISIDVMQIIFNYQALELVAGLAYKYVFLLQMKVNFIFSLMHPYELKVSV